MTTWPGTIAPGKGQPESRVTGTTPRNRPTYSRLNPTRRPDTGVGEWAAAMVRGLDALAFLERSRDLASEPVPATPARLKPRLDTIR